MKKTMINIICSLLVLITNVLVSFFLSPFIVKNIGVEANGFITLANNFITYAQLIVTALNSMAARYISIAYNKKDYKKANVYYNSVFWGNLIIVAVLIIPAIIFLWKLDKFVNIPNNILFDVKLLFGFVFLNFFITTGFPNWDCGTFITNRLDRAYIPQMFTSVLKCIILFICFTFFLPKVYYVGLVTTIITIVLLVCNGINTKVLTPKLHINISPKKVICSTKALKDLVISGLWNSISQVGNILLTGVDLIISNIFLGATSMGIISLTKTIPNYMDQLASSLTNTFTPEITINYANENKEQMLKDINRSMKLSSIITTIPIAITIVLGAEFFSLWVPSQDSQLLQILSILASFKFIFTGGIQILYNVFPTVNKVKENAISQIITGFVSIILTFLLIKFTPYGIYAVAGISSLCAVIKNLVYIIPACAKYLDLPWYTFYRQVINTCFSSMIIIIIGFIIKQFFCVNNWLSLFINAMTIGGIGLLINILITLNKNERNYLIGKLKNKIMHT